MLSIVSIFENYLVVLPVYLLLGWLLCRLYRKHGIAYETGFIIGWQVLAVYVCAVFYFTGTGGLDDIQRFGLSQLSSGSVNLLPLHDGGGAMGMALNALLFVPLGMLLPLLWKDCRRWYRTAGAGFLLSLLIELSQLFNFRATDIDDLLMNTLGTLAGYGVWQLLARRIPQFEANAAGKTACAAVGSLCTMFAIQFILAGPLVSHIALSLYGY